MNKFKNSLIVLLVIILLISIVLGVQFGSVDISVSDVYEIIIGKIFKFDISEFENTPTLDVIWLIRLPRILLAVLVGAGLALSGCVMQAVVNNPLADPYIMGVSSGAYFGAVLAIMLGVFDNIGENYVGIGAFIGAVGTSVLVLTISNIGGKSNTARLILAGTAISSAVSAISNFIVFIVNDSQKLKSISYWMMGSLAGVRWERLGTLFVMVIFALLFFFAHYRTLDLMLMGEETAITLGTNLRIYRNIFMIVNALIVGFIVYSSGMIGFVGLLVPHFARLLVGSGHKRLLFTSALLGGIILIWSDVLCRIIIDNSEVPIGILISLFGAPLFIYMLIKTGFKEMQ